MKKRFTLMMMLCFLMSIPLKMMAFDVVTVKSDYNGGSWTDAFNSNFTFTTPDGKIYTCKLDNVPSGNPIYFRIIKGGKQYGPNSNDEDLLLTSSFQTISENYNKALKIVPTSGKTSYTITYDSEKTRLSMMLLNQVAQLVVAQKVVAAAQPLSGIQRLSIALINMFTLRASISLVTSLASVVQQ